MSKTIFAVAGTALVSLAAGAYGGYLYAKRQLTEEFNSQMEQEIAATKAFYSAMHKKGDFETPEGAVNALHPEGVAEFKNDRDTMQKILDGLKYAPMDAGAAVRGEKESPVEVNIFDGVKQDLDVDPEDVPEPNPDRPYIIARDAFENSEVGYRQLTLTYFIEDNVLLDEDEDIVEDIEKWAGMGNLQRFGLQSGDPNVVYIRNEPMSVDFEVIRSRGSYKELVLGLTE